MYTLKHPDIFASEIAELLGRPLEGEDFVVTTPSFPGAARHNCFIFCLAGQEELITSLVGVKNLLVITDSKTLESGPELSIVRLANPQLSFVKIVNELFLQMDSPHQAASSIIDDRALIGPGVSIGEHSVIIGDVRIGADTIICSNVVIKGPVAIGQRCVIRDNATVGGEAFDFMQTEDGRSISVPHLGDVRIGDSVWVGANTTIERGLFGSTSIASDTKIDDLVNIGADCDIGAAVQVMACCVISRNAKVGDRAAIAPNASIREAVTIGKGAYIGIGSVVVKDLDDDVLAYGNPSRVKGKAGEAR